MTIFVVNSLKNCFMDKHRLSIIIPVYNAESYLARCLDSIFEQSFTSYEVILVDDGSTDSSPLICDRYSSTDPRFRTVHKKNGGVGSARNAGINLAKGEYIVFVDADDALLPEALERMMEEVAGEDLVIGGYTSFIGGIPGSEVLPARSCAYASSMLEQFFQDNSRKRNDVMEVPWAKMFRRKALGHLRFREDLNYGEDKLFVLNFLLSSSNVRTCAVPVYAYHMRPDSLGSDLVSDMHLMQMRRFLPAYADSMGLLAERFPSSSRLAAIYHKEVVGKYCCRVLKIFSKRKTLLLDADYISWVYELMSRDKSLKIMSFGFKYMFDMTLYRIGKPSFSVRSYKLVRPF